jgi:hypothetical protein
LKPSAETEEPQLKRAQSRGHHAYVQAEGRALLGAAPDAPAGVTVSRVADVALLTLGVACWLARDEAAGRAGKALVAALLLYNIGVVLVLALAWASPTPIGIAFWPVVLAHTGLTVWCVSSLPRR